MHASEHRAFIAMNLKRLFDFRKHMRELPRLHALACPRTARWNHRLCIAVHRVAHPHHRELRASFLGSELPLHHFSSRKSGRVRLQRSAGLWLPGIHQTTERKTMISWMKIKPSFWGWLSRAKPRMALPCALVVAASLCLAASPIVHLKHEICVWNGMGSSRPDQPRRPPGLRLDALGRSLGRVADDHSFSSRAWRAIHVSPAAAVGVLPGVCAVP